METLFARAFVRTPCPLDYIEYAKGKMRRDLLEKASEAMDGKNMTLSPIVFNTQQTWDGIEISARMEMQEVQSMRVATMDLAPMPMFSERRLTQAQPKDVCMWCGSEIRMDKRGCCSACGGPPGEKKVKGWTATTGYARESERYERMAKWTPAPQGLLDDDLAKALSQHMQEKASEYFSNLLRRG